MTGDPDLSMHDEVISASAVGRLSGWQIVLPRDPARCGTLLELLHAEGADVYSAAVQEYRPVPSVPAAGTNPATTDRPGGVGMPSPLNSLLLAFTSATAVEMFQPGDLTSSNAVLNSVPARPGNVSGPAITAYAVGEATARAIGARWPNWLVKRPPNGKNAAHLARYIIECEEPQRVTFPCSVEARPELPSLLAAAGFSVDRLEIYRSLPVEPFPSTIRDLFYAAATVDSVEPRRSQPVAIIAHSPSIVRAFSAQVPPERWGGALMCAIGETTASAIMAEYEKLDRVPDSCEVRGRLVVAKGPTPVFILDALCGPDFIAGAHSRQMPEMTPTSQKGEL